MSQKANVLAMIGWSFLCARPPRGTARPWLQRVDGRTYDRAGVLRHAAAVTARAAVTIERIVGDGRSAATVHTARVTKTTGQAVTMKVVAFYAFADGRLRLVDELTRLEAGGAEDRDLGSRS
ncbi:nuclear transport factor 2 family protein [Caenispirillum bisanense]|uniref:SnoaL-like domain-containing protein n=1 Tax=Caenispirillum bisanense TaxID=414052 RepID=A0A286G813_9PROT|nr:nuclear transport factor 2 family protein [Caenispirillum bisanense]SOD91653.1 SnoaL-like domain-containing protein [Caenispirillum bisanense]